jgi:hypothetical protein
VTKAGIRDTGGSTAELGPRGILFAPTIWSRAQEKIATKNFAPGETVQSGPCIFFSFLGRNEGDLGGHKSRRVF